MCILRRYQQSTMLLNLLASPSTLAPELLWNRVSATIFPTYAYTRIVRPEIVLRVLERVRLRSAITSRLAQTSSHRTRAPDGASSPTSWHTWRKTALAVRQYRPLSQLRAVPRQRRIVQVTWPGLGFRPGR